MKSQQNWLKQGVEKLAVTSINLLFLFWIRWNCLRSWRIRKLYLSIRRMIKQIIANTEAYQFANYAQHFIQHLAASIWDHHCGFRRNRFTADHILCIRQILEKKWEYKETVHQLFIDFKKTCDSVRRVVLCKVLIYSVIPMKMASAVEYARTKVIGSKTSFVIASVRSSIHWNIYI
jgi:hypothetical protein